MNRTKIVVSGIVVIAAVSAAVALPVKELAAGFLGWVEGLGALGPALLALAYVPATVFFVPGSVLTLGAGALFGPIVGTIAVSAGSTVGSTAAFVVGRFLARDWVAGKLRGNTRFEALDHAVGRDGFKIVLLTRLSPVFPYNMLGYAYGITDVKLSHYVLASWVGMLPGTFMYVYLGSLAGTVAAVTAGGSAAADAGPLKWVLYGVGLLATVAVTVVVSRMAARAMRETIPGIEAGAQPTDTIN